MTDELVAGTDARGVRETDPALNRPQLVARAVTLAVTVVLVAAALVVIG
jgi:hypothetical protein